MGFPKPGGAGLPSQALGTQASGGATLRTWHCTALRQAGDTRGDTQPLPGKRVISADALLPWRR
ncbi:hypothetical protein XAXN_06050 [Xanthomonas axonopodis]|uniref:Uncharacterized protein n=1 Tax=Xanthomonas axonopodis TaxID=53413 RepID=A0A0P6VUS9_9XANT|nr:hypothetical protein XAXN_06050 [Xanthomonas axonopodis]